MSTNLQKSRSGAAKVVFSVTSPGFLYSAIVLVLTIFAVSGVQFPTSTEQLAGEIVTTLSASGVYAIIGVVVASVVFPIYNAARSGLGFSLATIFGSTLTWIALGNIILSLLALYGFILPDGTLEQIIAAVQTKDWISLGSLFVTTIVPTLIRWIKDRNKPVTA